MRRRHNEPAVLSGRPARGESGAREDRKPDSPPDLHRSTWGYVIKKSFREFSDDQCTDIAAALTYYAVLAVFPAILALTSMLSLFGNGASTVDAVMKIVRQVGPPSAVDAVRPMVESFTQAPGAGVALIVGLAGALWSASGYVGAFGRAMNRVYEIGEGRPVWKLRPMQLLVTLISLVLVAVAAVLLVVSGPVATAIGEAIGIGSTLITVWEIAKWPVLLAVVVLLVAILYWATPNVKQPRFRWISVGAVTAIAIWIIASALFGLYVATFSNYSKTYGSLAGIIVLLLWLWITNLALLFGAEVDSELERGRELEGGIAAENELQLPARDTHKIQKAEKKERRDVEQGREIRRNSRRHR